MFQSLNRGVSAPVSITIIVVVAVVVVGGIWAFQYFSFVYDKGKEWGSPPVTETPEDETTGWKTYRNEECGFEFKYPKDFIISREVWPDYCVIELKNKNGRPYPIFDVSINWPTGFEFVTDYKPYEDFIVDGYNVKIQYLDPGYATGYFSVISISKDNNNYMIRGWLAQGDKNSEASQEEIFKKVASTFKFIQIKYQTAGWKTYRNEEYGFSLRHPNQYKVSSLGPNEEQQTINSGGTISGTVQPSHSTIKFYDDNNEIVRAEIFQIYKKEISVKNYQHGDYLYLRGPCDIRWGFNPKVIRIDYTNEIKMLIVEGKDQEDRSQNCYYFKNLEGNLIVFSSKDYKFDQIFSDLDIFKSKLPVIESEGSIYWAKLTKEGDNEDLPLEFYQAINTPDRPFEVVFDYIFMTRTGVLNVMLESVVLGAIDTQYVTIGRPSHFRILVTETDADLFSLKDAIFGFWLFGPAGSQVLITNIAVNPL